MSAGRHLRVPLPGPLDDQERSGLRDLDTLCRINRVHATVSFTITTADDGLARELEPGAPAVSARLRAMEALADQGVHTGVTLMPLLPFIFGLDGDTPENLRHRTTYMIRSGVDVMQTTCLAPLPGTRLFDRLEGEGRLLHADFPRDWARYDMTEVAHRPRGLTPAALTESTHASNRRMYAWPTLARKAMRTLWATRNPTATMFAWQSNINYRNVSRAG